MRIRFRFVLWAIVLAILAVGVGVIYLEDAGVFSLSGMSEQPLSPATGEESAARTTPTPIPVSVILTPTTTPYPIARPTSTPTPSPVEIYTPTIEADEYKVSGPSMVVFRVPTEDYDFASRHIIGLDDAATKDVTITLTTDGDEYVIRIESPDALETPDEDVGVFVGDVEADFCGDPQPVLTVNEPIDGARWKPTRWWCTPYGGGGDNDIHMFPTLSE